MSDLKLTLARLMPATVILAGIVLPAPAVAQEIYFLSDREGTSELYVMNADGSEQTRLTDDLNGDGTLDLSPDGSRFLGVSNRDGNYAIHLVSTDGGSLKKLTHPSSDHLDTWPHWAPDGTRFPFERFKWGVQDSESGVQVGNANGPSVQRIDESGMNPEWSPTSDTIAFWNWDGTTGDIFVINANGSGKKQVTDHPDEDREPVWSPDGSRILFHCVDDERNYDLCVVNANGSGRKRLTDQPGSDTHSYSYGGSSWSSDGSRIVFRSQRDGDPEVYVMNADGSKQQNLSRSPGADGAPVWTPDGQRILFVSTRDGNSEIYTMNADGSGLANLTNNPATDSLVAAFGDFPPIEVKPSITSGGIVLANLLPTVSTVSPLSIITLFGNGLSDETVLFPNLDSEGKVDTILAGVCVEVGGKRSPIFAVTPTQVNLQTPGTPNLGPVDIVVLRDCDTPEETRSDVEAVTVELAAPAFFVFAPISSDGFIAARFNDGYAAVAPDSLFEDQFGPSRPAVPGDIILLFGTGWGDTEAALLTGELAPGAAQLLPDANPMVLFGGVPLAPADVFYVGVTPNTAGLFQLAIRVPAGATPGNHQVVLTVYSKSSPTGPVVPVGAP